MTDYEYEEVNIYRFVDLLKLEIYESIFSLKKRKKTMSYLNIQEAIIEGIDNAADRAFNERDDVFE